MEADLRQLSLELLSRFEHEGHCEFVDAYAKRLPIVTFLRLVDLPSDDRDKLLALTELSVRPKSEEDRGTAFTGRQQYMRRWVGERKMRPAKDLLSRRVNAEIGNRPISEVELAGLIPTVIFGGLDTVASALSFTARALAENPPLRRQSIANPALLPAAIEEFFRRFGIANTARVIEQDIEIHGVTLRKGEMILLSKTSHGLDERSFADPLKIDFTRPGQAHAAFGDGPHRCPDAPLARLEVRVFLVQWLEHIPDFHITPGENVVTCAGSVNGLLSLPLSWQTRA